MKQALKYSMKGGGGKSHKRINLFWCLSLFVKAENRLPSDRDAGHNLQEKAQ